MGRHGTKTIIAGLAAGVGLVAVLAVALFVLAPDATSTHHSAPRTPSASPMTGSPSPEAGGSAIFPGGLYVEPDTSATRAEKGLRSDGDEAAATLVNRISSQPTAIWLGEWIDGAALTKFLQQHVAASRTDGSTLVFVTYAIPHRDCGGYSAGGLTYDTYLDWNRRIAAALSGTHAAVLIEPDSLSMLSDPKCGDEATKRLPLIQGAADILRGAGLTTYLDGGNSRWHSPRTQAAVLEKAGIGRARGFFTNVSNFNTLAQERDYAGKLSALVGDAHYVVDVSRSGTGWQGDWCNPQGAGLGPDPRATPDEGRLDAELWVKHPGVSDGTCNGGPAAGDWWESYALDLVKNG